MQTENTNSLSNISAEKLEDIRSQMLKFAILQLKDVDLAEDVVQEAFLSAYKNINSFKGGAAFKTWIFTILKNKIIDLIRYKSRTITVSDIDQDDDTNAFFDEKDHWNLSYHEPNEWKNIQSSVYKKQFWTVFETCLMVLPTHQGRIFMMREYLEMDSKEICQECDISTSNLHVILYRARLQLQSCLSKNWFEGK
ncbi:sigma-70 family RNA polymerase sigma factor [Otariodibacter sp.]|uniref:sigma-70 family RNA polymerase sigma factor n=1 Tax=Otariodibacter sp. TaxID=3030919 RepID=UPI0026395789|nr:sigma-70 family RNA polymerase sigma factor [Otariodibacter sp.]